MILQISGEQFEIDVLPSASIQLHEESDIHRLRRLTRRIRAEKVLYNPLIIARYGSRFILLDGANRFEALKALGCRYVLTQIVDYGGSAVKLDTWHHFVPGFKLSEAIEFLRAGGLTAVRKAALPRKIHNSHRKMFLYDRKDMYEVRLPPGLKDLLVLLSSFSRYYEAKYNYDRIAGASPEILMKFTRERGLFILNPAFRKSDILKIAAGSVKLPAGISRHLLPNRVLHLKYPVSYLSSYSTLSHCRRRLSSLVNSKVSAKKVRLYVEPLLIFDE